MGLSQITPAKEMICLNFQKEYDLQKSRFYLDGHFTLGRASIIIPSEKKYQPREPNFFYRVKGVFFLH